MSHHLMLRQDLRGTLRSTTAMQDCAPHFMKCAISHVGALGSVDAYRHELGVLLSRNLGHVWAREPIRVQICCLVIGLDPLRRYSPCQAGQGRMSTDYLRNAFIVCLRRHRTRLVSMCERRQRWHGSPMI